MDLWDEKTAGEYVLDFSKLSTKHQRELIERLNNTFPPQRFAANREARLSAAAQMKTAGDLLKGSVQHYPPIVESEDISVSFETLKDCAVLLTAGGEGERLRKSLESTGISENMLKDFTKATFPLPDFFDDFGTLQVNLALLAQISDKYNLSLSVIVSTGPYGSTTARVIPPIVRRFSKAGIHDAVTIMQDERLHLTVDGKIAWQISGDEIRPITHPDETGGPIMKLKTPFETYPSLLTRLKENGCKKVLVLQATAVYDPHVIGAMAEAASEHDCVGVGILRDSFPEDDPYGTFVEIERENERKIHIIEQGIRDERTRKIVDSRTGKFLPYNTGFYAFDIEMLENNDLPDYATPPKEILPDLERTPKVGYAATDLLPPAKRPVILAVNPQSFGVIKKADDLSRLSSLAKSLELRQACEFARQRI